MALTQTQIDSIYWHLGYTNDLYYTGAKAYLLRILNSLTTVAETNVTAMIIRCDNAFSALASGSTYFNKPMTTVATGDANITNTKTTEPSYGIKMREYISECNLLASLLGVDNYNVGS